MNWWKQLRCSFQSKVSNIYIHTTIPHTNKRTPSLGVKVILKKHWRIWALEKCFIKIHQYWWPLRKPSTIDRCFVISFLNILISWRKILWKLKNIYGEKQINHWNKFIILKHFDILYNMPMRWMRRIYVCSSIKWVWQIAQLTPFETQRSPCSWVCSPLLLSLQSLVCVFFFFILKVLQSTSCNTQPCCLVEHLFSASFQELPLVDFLVQVCIHYQRPLK